jgi:hypothetical protein
VILHNIILQIIQKVYPDAYIYNGEEVNLKIIVLSKIKLTIGERISLFFTGEYLLDQMIEL